MTDHDQQTNDDQSQSQNALIIDGPTVDQDAIGRWGYIVKGDRVCQVIRNIICRILEPEIDLLFPLTRTELERPCVSIGLPTEGIIQRGRAVFTQVHTDWCNIIGCIVNEADVVPLAEVVIACSTQQ